MAEMNRKQKGFMRGKLVISFFRTAKPAASSNAPFSSKAKPTPSSASVGFRVDQDLSIPSAAKQKISFAKPDSVAVCGSINNLYGGRGDEKIDIKAENYISYVHERFRKEHDMV